MATILIIEDDLEISRLLTDFLSANGHTAICQSDGLRVLEFLDSVDLILLDIMLPYKSGDMVLSNIREVSTIPVIVISAKGMTQNKVDLLRLGADDYITKPFDLEETLARIESTLRRVSFQTMPQQYLQYKDMVLDLDSTTVCVKGQTLSLTAKEFAILELLMKYPSKVFSKSNLFQSVWGEEYFCEDNTINVHISNLRSKLKAAGAEEYIDTVWGIGYRLHQS